MIHLIQEHKMIQWIRIALLLTALIGTGIATPLPSSCRYPTMCPNEVLPRSDTQTWQMNRSTIIQPCNDTGFTSPSSTLGWSVVDFDWSNAKGTGNAPGWAKHSPMDDEEMLFQQVQMTTSATPGTTVWVYRGSVYAYPWYTSVRTILDDPAYASWFIDFKPTGPWHSPKCDNNFTPPKCSDHYHMQEQSPGFPHGDGDCKAPGCDCGSQPCGFYLFNHSATAMVHGQSFQDWFVHSYVLNKVGMSPLVSGFFWDDHWPEAGGKFADSTGDIANDTGLNVNLEEWDRIADSWGDNMNMLRQTTLKLGKFAWQLMWTGGPPTSVGGMPPPHQPLVKQLTCASDLRTFCQEAAAPQTRAMLYTLNTTCRNANVTTCKLLGLKQDLVNFLLIRGEYAWLGHGFVGCSKQYPYPKVFHADYGRPVDRICHESAPGIFVREWSNVKVEMNCNTWEPALVWEGNKGPRV